jgi:hypothetical protein
VAFDAEPGDFGGSALGIDWITMHVAADTIKQNDAVSWNFYNGTTSSGCGSEQPGIVLNDCIESLEIFSPVVVDGHRHPGVEEPGSVLLLATGAALGLGAWRGRRYAA